MAMKGFPAFLKAQHYPSLPIWLFSVISRHSLRMSYPSTEKQLVYSTAQDDWAEQFDVILNQNGPECSIKNRWLHIIPQSSMMRGSLVSYQGHGIWDTNKSLNPCQSSKPSDCLILLFNGISIILGHSKSNPFRRAVVVLYIA